MYDNNSNFGAPYIPTPTPTPIPIPYIINDNTIYGIIILQKEDILDIFISIKNIFTKITRYFLKIIKHFATINEMLYTSLDYSEAKTITGLIMVICFITILSGYLFCSILNKNNKMKQLEKKIKELQELQKE